MKTTLIDVYYAELLSYEEFENLSSLRQRASMRSIMHTEVSTNRFVACVRVYQSSPGQSYRWISTTNTGWINQNYETGVSLPLTPSTRIMNSVTHTLQKARERLMSLTELMEE
jgi:hypothetical protein